MDLNLFVSVLLHKEAVHTPAANQTNANAGSGMEMTVNHQKSLSLTAQQRGFVAVFTTTALIFPPFFSRTGITPAGWFVSPFIMLIPASFSTHVTVVDVRRVCLR